MVDLDELERLALKGSPTAIRDLIAEVRRLREEVDALQDFAGHIRLDCGDNSCEFAESKGGVRTNGGCRCIPKEFGSKRRMAMRRAVIAAREAAKP